MAKVPKDLERLIEDVMDEFGVDRWDIDKNRRKHPRLNFVLGGQLLKFTLPGTPSDPRSLMNCRADLRRMCRLQSSPEHNKLPGCGARFTMCR